MLHPGTDASCGLPAAASTSRTPNGHTAADAGTATTLQYPYYVDGPLRKVHPYNHTYLTYAKARWIGREILEIFSTEFRDRSKEFYEWAISTGTVMVNGNVVDASYVIENGDLISNVMHRHEPPILGGKIKLYHRDDENGIWVVEKKASMPIHATGRYRKNTLLEVLKNEYGLEHVNTLRVIKLTHFGSHVNCQLKLWNNEKQTIILAANRLDRLVSGIMIITTKKEAAQKLGKSFQTPGTVKKEYIARCKGCFPEGEEIICEEPLLSIDKQIGVNVVHPEGRPSKTIFTRISYDPISDTSVVKCQPITGRTHQLRVHLQFLGYPIANDPIYSNKLAWGENVGKGGLFNNITIGEKKVKEEYRQSSNEHQESVSRMVDALAATFSPSLNEKNELEQEPVNMETLASQQSSRLVMSRELESGVDSPFDLESGVNSPMELESEMNTPMEPESGRDSPMERPTPPSSTIKEDIRKQRKEKKDLQDFKNKHPEFNKRKGASIHLNDENDELKGGSEVKLVPQAIEAIKFLRKVRDEEDDFARYKDMERIQPPPMPLNLSSSSSSSSNHFNTAPPSSLNTANITKVNGTNRPKTAKRGIKMMTNKERELLSEETRSQELIELQNQNPEYYIEKDLITGSTFCNVCGTPLLPDPKIEQLSIWLHAIRYYTDEWDYSSPLPDWAREDWQDPGTRDSME